MKNFKLYLKNQFEMVDMDEIRLFLGINVQRRHNEISIDQTIYLENVLKRFNMSDCNPVNTPLPVKLDSEALNSNEVFEAPSRNLIGCLMYAMQCTRPDLCTAINFLSRYQNKNNKELWQNLKRVLRYIKGTIKLKLTYSKSLNIESLVGYVDADWGGNETDRRSTTGYMFKLFGNLVSWNTKRQNSVAASSTEAEYMALFEAVRETLWIKSLLQSIDYEIKGSIVIFEDNQSCISIANNPAFHKRSKHIDIKYHFTREQIENNTIIIKYISTDNQLADIFTKQLPSPKFNEIIFKIGLKE